MTRTYSNLANSADPIFQGFLQTDRDGNPRGIVALDPKELLL